jgi:hypothetical protein
VKKSEMLEIIGNVIADCPMEYDVEDIALAVLEAAEKAGMLPPANRTTKGKSGQGFDHEYYYWEPEDSEVKK